MASRQLGDWLEGYLEFTEDTEPARIFQHWVGLSCIAAALRKKVSLSLGRIKIYPNLYIVLVAEPGVARKSQAINFGLDILSNIPDIVTCADAITKEALLQDLEASAAQEQLPSGEIFTHASINVISREFESFLGQKSENTKMLVLLTDLFDAQELPWRYRTKGSGSNILPSLFLNLQAATTPDSLASCLPSTAVGGGLTSRIIFVWADRKHKKVTKPELTPAMLRLKEALIKDLYIISRLNEMYSFSPEADILWDKWYKEYDEMNKDRICRDPSFNGWYSRKPTYVLKLSIIHAACKSNTPIIQWSHIQSSLDIITEIEGSMGNVFKAIGKSTITPEVDITVQIIKSAGWIKEKQLLSMIWRDVDATKFENVIATAIRKGDVKREYIGPRGERGEVWYRDAMLKVDVKN